MTATTLDPDLLAALRERAHAEAWGFVDPARFRAFQEQYPTWPPAWRDAIVGRATFGPRELTWPESVLLLLAADLDQVGLDRARAALKADNEAAIERAQEPARAAYAAQRAAWVALRARLPVNVEVWHNWTARHLDGYVQGADHIVTRQTFRVGRIVRLGDQPLCWTPSRAHELRHVQANGEEKEDRVPTCKACWRTAERIATEEGLK